MTGLYNFRTFKARLEEHFALARRHKRPLSILLMDVDHFKKVNDTHGHPQGDAVLKTLAKVIKDATRTTDIVCRYGGEEFTVILPETDTEGAEMSAEKIRKAFENTRIPLLDGSGELIKTVRLGVSSMTLDNPKNIEEMIHRADENLYVAKESGRNRVISTRKNPKKKVA